MRGEAVRRCYGSHGFKVAGITTRTWPFHQSRLATAARSFEKRIRPRVIRFCYARPAARYRGPQGSRNNSHPSIYPALSFLASSRERMTEVLSIRRVHSRPLIFRCLLVNYSQPIHSLFQFGVFPPSNFSPSPSPRYINLNINRFSTDD